MTNTNFSRRDLFKLGGITAATIAATGALAGCGQPAVRDKETEADAAPANGGPAFLTAPEPITDFAETHDYDVVVVGAGESGRFRGVQRACRPGLAWPACRTPARPSQPATWRPAST